MRSYRKTVTAFVVVTFLFVSLIMIACNTGSIKVGFWELVKGLFVEYNENVAKVYDLRFPRILVSILAGAALGVSGVLFQAVMRNPLADPTTIGVSSGASFVAILVTAFFPQWYFVTPIFAFLGGMLSLGIVYLLSWKQGLRPIRIILVGVAINAIFQGLIEGMDAFSGSNASTLINGSTTMKTWDDVKMLAVYVIIGLICAIACSFLCNLLMLEDKTARSIGVNITLIRIGISFIAVLLASISTAVIGMIAFVGLIVPHIARLLVGGNHKVLLPFSTLLGACLLLFADTVGRTIAMPYEINASIIMAVVGGPFFIFLLHRSEKI